MRLCRRIPVAAIVLAASLSAARGAVHYPEPAYTSVVAGVQYGCVKLTQPPVIYHAVKVDLATKGYLIRAINARENECLAALAERAKHDEGGLIVAINGDYFSHGENTVPKGILVTAGELLFSPAPNRSAFALDTANRPFIEYPRMSVRVALGRATQWREVKEVNRLRGAGEKGAFLYTSGWRGSVPAMPQGQTLVVRGGPLRVGQETQCRFDKLLAGEETAVPTNGFVITMDKLPSTLASLLEKNGLVAVRVGFEPPAVEAIGGGPRIVRGRRVSIEFEREDFAAAERNYLDRKAHPRSAIGYNGARNELILCVVQGRCAESQGMTARELAELMIGLGAVDAMSFDGGGSVGLYVGDQVVMRGNSHDGTPENRALANALAVFAVPKEVK